MNKRCIGCGVLLQIENEGDVGYTKSMSMDYCVRCFQMTHYGNFSIVYHPSIEEDVLFQINQIPSHVFFFIDFLNLHEESFSFFKKIMNSKTLVVTKLDTIPQSVYFEKIYVWLSKMCHTKDILMIRDSNSSVRKIEEKMRSCSFQNILFAGVTNAGKSTFLNRFLNQNSITVSCMPNTTLDFIQIPYSTYILYDTPGLCYHTYPLSPKLFKQVNVKGEIKPITYPISAGNSLLIGNLFRISFSYDTSVTWFSSSNVETLKIYEKNKTFMDQNMIELSVLDNSNLYIKGIGFFYFKYGGMVHLYNMEEEFFSLLPSFFS